VISVGPASLFLAAFRSYRGSLIFGIILVSINAISWLSALTSESEFAGLSVVYGAFLAFGSARWNVH
jgi:hypothetical protein